MNNWTIRQRILGSFALILGLMFLMGGIAYTQLASIKEKTEELERDSLPGVYYSGRIARSLILDFALTAEHILEADATKMQHIASKLETNHTEMETQIQGYEGSIFTEQDREMFDAFKAQLVEYETIQQEVFKLSVSDPHGKDARALLTTSLIPKFAQTRSAIYAITDSNKKSAEEDMGHILLAIKTANTGVFASFGIALLFTIACGYFLLRAINQPLQQLVGVVDIMGTGDFTQRIKLNRRDEFGSLADGFNRMTDELTALVSEVQLEYRLGRGGGFAKQDGFVRFHLFALAAATEDLAEIVVNGAVVVDDQDAPVAFARRRVHGILAAARESPG